MSMLGKLMLSGVVVFAALKTIRPSIPALPAVAEVQVPPEVRRILDKSCYGCHSDERRLALFDQIVTAYWLVRQDVLTARDRLNVSTLGMQPSAAQRASLFESVNFIQLGAMLFHSSPSASGSKNYARRPQDFEGLSRAFNVYTETWWDERVDAVSRAVEAEFAEPAPARTRRNHKPQLC